MKIYSTDDYDYIEEHNQFDYDTNLYIDSAGKPITGVLLDFKYYTQGDPRNHWFAYEGNRVCSVPELKELLDEVSQL